MSDELSILMIEGTRLNHADEWTTALAYPLNNGEKVSFFKSLLLTPPVINERYMFGLSTGYHPARIAEWEQWVELLFAHNGWLSSIHQAVSQTNLPVIDIWITLPYPRYGQKDAGKIHKQLMNFQHQKDRIAALQWWITYVKKQFEEYAIKSIHLRGFAWGRESIPASDQDLVQSVNEFIRSLKLESFWLANYGTAQLLSWNELGFNHVSVFSNYTGKTGYGIDFLTNTIKFALFYKLGLQIICGRGLRFDDEHFSHYLKQLEIYRNSGGSGPYLYRFPNQSLYHLHQQQPSQYKLVYQSLQNLN